MVWEDFDWEDKVIRIEAKTKATRIIPILPTLNHALKAHGGASAPQSKERFTTSVTPPPREPA